MYFPFGTLPEAAMRALGPQIHALAQSPHGFDISASPHKKTRTLRQNSLWWEIMTRIAKFCEDSGWKPRGLERCQSISAELLHEFFKAVYAVKSTARMSAEEFGRLVDRLQNDMITATRGEYEPLIHEQ